MYRIHVKEIAWSPTVEERVHLSCRGVVRVQDGPDIKDNRFPSTPEYAEVYLADLAVRRADHHLDKIRCVTGDGDSKLVPAERRHHVGSTSAGPPRSAPNRSISSEGRAAIPWSWTA
jgi:hypothetical protein